MVAGGRMVHAEAAGGAPAHAHPRLHAGVHGHQATVVEQALRLPVLPPHRLLGYQRPCLAAQQALQRRITRARTDNLPHAAAGGAERRLQPVGKRQTRQVGLLLDRPPSGLRQPELIEQPRERELALHTRERGGVRDRDADPRWQQRLTAASSHACSWVASTTSMARSATTSPKRRR
jgi:hypothetical protein